MKLGYLIVFIFTMFLTVLNANDKKVDCIILADENSIICKYSHERIDTEQNITVSWIEPNGMVTRTRDMIIPAFHGSVYDYRYVEGRTPGEWIFTVKHNEDEYTTSFTIE
jgi:hypothetical protein